MKEKKLFIPTLYLLVLFSLTIAIYFSKKTYDNYNKGEKFDNITFVSNNILNRSIPIINETQIINTPYLQNDISIIRYFYNSNDDIERKENSIVFYGNTYMQNTGIDYIDENVFDIVSIYDGTVIDIVDDELLGKTIKIRHNGEIVSVYQGIENIEVVKGDIVLGGQKIATSGTSEINKEYSNSLHFEIYKNGKSIDPLLCFNKKIGDI